MTVTWMPPFTLSDISHYLINVTNSDNASHELGAVTLSNNPSYSFVIADLGIHDRCTKSYEFVVSVGGVNFAGEGDFSKTTVTIPQDKRYCITGTISHGTILNHDSYLFGPCRKCYTASAHRSHFHYCDYLVK